MSSTNGTPRVPTRLENGSPPDSPGQPKHPIATAVLPIFVVAAALISVMYYSFWRVHHLEELHPPQLYVTHIVISEINNVHLWIEELLSGDATIPLGSVDQELAEIQSHLRVLKNGGFVHGHHVQALEVTADLALLDQMNRRLNSFREIYQQRLARPAENIAGSPLDQEFDSVFYEFQSAASNLLDIIGERMNGKMEALRHEQMFIVLASIVASLLFVCMSWSNARTKRSMMHEIVEAKNKAEANHKWLITTLECMGDGVIITDSIGKVTYLNPRAEHLTGWSRTEALDKPVIDVFDIRSEDFPERTVDFVERILNERLVVGLANHTVLLRKDGSQFPIADSGAPILNSKDEVLGAVVVFQDMSERHESAVKLETSLREKDVLLREVHHRVKNNMQIIVSLLDLQAREVQDPNAAQRFKDIQNHIMTMSLVHEKLYTSPDLSRVDFGGYLKGLVKLLSSSMGAKVQNVRMETEVQDVDLPLDKAVPCGLLVNELVTNALKHAYPGGRSGVVRVGLYNDGPGHLLLSVQDDGVGLPEGVDPNSSNSFGLRLLRTLTHQLQGELSFESGAGFSCRLRMPKAPVESI